MDDADASGARPGEGAIRFSHSGYRYLLGYGTDFFGIWDREQPGGPVLRFPRTDEGWDKAWYEYFSREKHNVEVVAAGTAYKLARVRGRWTRGLLYGHVAGALAVVVVLTYDITQLAQVSRGLVVDIQEVGQRISGMFSLLLFLGFYPAPAAIAWLLWQYRTHQNLNALGSTGFSYTPGWSIAWWFIPIAIFAMPYRMVRELWKASDPSATGDEWKRTQTPAVLPLWWGTWLGSLLLFIAGAQFGRTGDIPRLITEAGFGIAAALAMAFAGILAARVVRQIDVRQEEKHDEVGPSRGYVIRPRP
ncbi:MAG TPA: DUF4328 domain-containing protein [Actinomycetota bacterium]|nr:DUF4328 domain-containing protein [Actinomycetota bacterium]